jgi:prepilin-type processing-associated H-X9-DG protein
MTAGMGPPMEPFKVRPWGEALVPQLGMCAGTTFGRNDPDAGAVFAKLFRGTYRCPSDDVHIDEHWEYKATQLYLGHWSYGKNVLFEYNNAWDRKYDSFATFGAINRPADTVLFGEILATQMSDHFMVDAWLDDGSNATVDKARHGKTSNYIFADFHAEPAAFKNIFNPADGVNHFDPNQ